MLNGELRNCGFQALLNSQESVQLNKHSEHIIFYVLGVRLYIALEYILQMNFIASTCCAQAHTEINL